jgi:4-hydroxy-3-methylbut-2-enyl diphosphate reductase
MDIPGSKDLFSALAWSVMIVLIPLSGAGEEHARLLVWLIFALIFLMVLARSIIHDFRDLQADRMVGKETIPILLGVNLSRAIIHTVMALAALLLLAGFAKGLLGLQGAGIAAGLVWLWLCVPVFTRKTLIHGLRAELLIDFGFILAGGLGLLLGQL